MLPGADHSRIDTLINATETFFTVAPVAWCCAQRASSWPASSRSPFYVYYDACVCMIPCRVFLTLAVAARR